MSGGKVHVSTVESEVEGFRMGSEAATLPLAEKKGKSKEKKPKEEKRPKTVTVVETTGHGSAPEEFPLPPPEDTLLNLMVLNR